MRDTASAGATVTPQARATRPVLTVRDVRKTFRRSLWPRHEVEVLRGVDLDVRPGEIVGLVGENGSGKSTLMKIVVGLLPADTGRVEQSGTVGYCPQSPLLWDKLTVDEHFELFGRAYALPSERVDESAAALLRELQFERFRDRRVEELSGGTRQKLNLALSLLHEPALLLADEPYAGFDWETYLRFWDLVADRRDRGTSVLIVSHLLSERDRLDRVVELRDGKVLAT